MTFSASVSCVVVILPSQPVLATSTPSWITGCEPTKHRRLGAYDLVESRGSSSVVELNRCNALVFQHDRDFLCHRINHGAVLDDQG